MSEGRERSPWMGLEELNLHFKFHEVQRSLLSTGLERMKTEGPAFIVLHTGAALRPDGAEARNQLLEAISDKIQQEKAQAEAATDRAQAWNDIHDQIVAMTDDDPWKNPLWEREIIKGLRKSIRNMPTARSTQMRHGDRIFGHRFRRGFTYRDVVCVHKNRFSAFKVDRSKIDPLYSMKGHWNSLFPEIEFHRKVFKWMVFPKDLSGNSTIAYLQYGNMAMPKAGRGHTRRYDFELGKWREGESVESWTS